MKSSTAFFSFFLAVIISLLHTHASGSQCDIELVVFLSEPRSYITICDCKRENSEMTDVVARTQVFIPGNLTNAQAAATRRCFEQDIPALRHTCEDRRAHFIDDATHTLERCLKEEPNAEEMTSQAGTFGFSRDNCNARFERVIQSENTNVWLCTCPQDAANYRISIARAQYFSDNSPTTPIEEIAFVDQCTSQNLEQLSGVCKQNPGAFETVALQLMETCCKRFRQQFPVSKLACDEVVPNQVPIVTDI